MDRQIRIVFLEDNASDLELTKRELCKFAPNFMVEWTRDKETLTGWGQDEAVDRPIQTVFRIMNEKTLQPAKDIIRQVLDEKCVLALANHTALVAKDGRIVPVEDSAAPILDSDGNLIGVVLVFHDVTEERHSQEALQEAKDQLEIRFKERTTELEQTNRKLQEEIAERMQAEEAVKAERQRFNDVLETLPAYLVLLTPDYHVLFANRFFRECFGESHGRRCFEYLFGRSEPCEICETYTVLKTMAPHEWEWTGPDGRDYFIHDFPFTGTDGSTLILEMGIDITERKRAEIELEKHRERLEDLVRERTRELENANARLQADITERKRAEGALRASEERFRTTLASIGDAVITTDEKGTVTFLNTVAEALTGWSLGEALGEPLEMVFRIINEQTREPAKNPVETALREGVVVGLGNHTALIVRDGREIPIEDSAAPIKDVAGRIIGVVTVFHDVTAKRNTERALRVSEERHRALAEELRVVDRHKNEFMAVLSHELRNPLASIQNSLHILDRATPGGDQAKRAKAVIDRQAGQLAHLVDDLLDVTRITQNKIKLQRTRIELNELVRRALDDHRTLFEQHEVRLEAVLSPSPLFVNADGARLAQVIGNLLQNAVKFTHRDGKVTVSVAGDSSERAVIRVADTGVGMPPEVLPRLFQPFMQADTTLDRSRGGLGLGLALSKGLVELHGGEIGAHSAGINKGSEFTVCLPLDDTSAVEARDSREQVPHRSRRVLIIEDHVDLAEGLRELLEFDGHEVSVAYSGAEGLAKACEFLPEILLCDIGLPGMDGYAVARAFRADEVLREVYLVALTGYALPEDLQRAADAGFDRHLAKPPDLEALERMLAEVPGGGSAGNRGAPGVSWILMERVKRKGGKMR